jgi:transposase InsO family protein
MTTEEKSGIGKFKGDGFDHWKFRVEIFLTKHQVENCLTENYPTDASQMAAFKTKDNNAKHLLVSLIDDNYLEVVKDKKTAKEMWEAMNKTFSKSGAVSQHILRRRLNNLKLEPGEKMKDFFTRFDEITRELKASGAKLDEADIRSSLTINLPDEYDPLITALENIENLSIEVLKARLMAEEEKKLARENRASDPVNSNAMYMNKGRSQHKKVVDKKNITCYQCGKKGHFKSECEENKSGTSSVANLSKAMFALSAISPEGNEWILDSGASNHMTSSLKFLTDVKKFQDPIGISVAKKDEMIYATHEGVLVGFMHAGVKRNSVKLEKVWYVPELQCNLLSVRAIDRKGISVIFERQTATIKDRDEVYGKTFLSETGLYSILIDPCVEKANLCDVWHRRFGHASDGFMKQLKSKNMVKGLENATFNDSVNCETCIKAKQTRMSYNGTRPPTTRSLQRIHSDVIGPISPVAYDGAKYVVSFVDDYTHFCYMFTIKEKSQVFECFKEYQALAEAKFNSKISILRIDNGSEYLSKAQRTYYKQKGIVLETTIAYTPQLNGVAERMNRTLMDKTRAMLLDGNVDKKLWSEAIGAAAYVINRSPTNALKGNKTPAELWYGEKPDVRKLRVFGCDAYRFIPKEKRGKLDARSEKLIMVGYSPNGYRLYDKSKNKLVLARDVKFNEGLSNSTSNQEGEIREVTIDLNDEPDYSEQENLQLQEDEPILNDSEDENEFMSANEDDEAEERDVQADEPAALPPQNELYSGPSRGMQRRSGRECRPPGKLTYNENFRQEESPVRISNAFLVEPSSYAEVKRRSDAEQWLKAVNEELESLEKNSTWKLVVRPRNIKPITSKWVFKLKKNADGVPERYKARLVARGFLQKAGIDYQETYAPVAKLATIRTVIAVANQHKMHIHQMDVKTAFLNGKLEEDVFMEIPEGLDSRPGYVCKLEKSLYGLKQSPLCWNNRFNKFATSIGFERSKHDYCLYVRQKNEESLMYMILYVDDVIIAGKSLNRIKEIKTKLQETFEMTDMGKLQHFLGIKIDYNEPEGKVELSQAAAIQELLERFDMQDCKPVGTPLETAISIDANKQEEKQTKEPYRELIGKLMYIMLGSRPDLCYAISYLSRFQDNPSDTHWQYAKRLLRYLKGTESLKLVYDRKEEAPTLEAFADADYANDTETRKSVSGHLIKVFGSTVLWSSKKQQTVALSSAEAEYIAMASACQDVIWMRGLLEDMKISLSATTIYEDNQGAIFMAKNLESKRAKHIDVKYHFIREKVHAKIVEIKHVSTELQQADIMTKSLPKPKFDIIKRMMGFASRGGVEVDANGC